MQILITGAAGKIGRALREGLQAKYEWVGVDKNPGSDITQCDLVTEKDKFAGLIRGTDAIIHLAWDTRESGTKLEPLLPENKAMGELAYKLALEEHIPRVILASSVHAAMGHIPEYSYPEILNEPKRHKNLHHPRKIAVTDGFAPLGGYGASKVYLETLGSAYARRGLQVIAVRFGNVTADNGYGEYPLWLSHADLAQFIEKCLTANNLPLFSTFFAISNNACNPFDLSDAIHMLNYQPQDGTKCPYHYD